MVYHYMNFRSDAWSGMMAAPGILRKILSCASQGDWAGYKPIFQLTGWRESIGCCFRCNITNERTHECGATAILNKPASRLTHVDNIARVWQKGQPINHSCGILFLPVNKSTLIRCTLQIWEYPSYFWEVFSLECWKPWVEIIVKLARLCGPESRISIK